MIDNLYHVELLWFFLNYAYVIVILCFMMLCDTMFEFYMIPNILVGYLMGYKAHKFIFTFVSSQE